MNRKFLYFINPISGNKSKAPILRLIETCTQQEGIPYEIYNTRKDGDYSYLKEKITAEQITDIIICGGDGTVSQVAAWLLETDVNIGIIPMGSGNGLALAAGIQRNAKEALRIIFKGNASPIDCFYINNRFSCMLCGLGFDAQVAHDFALQKKRGLITYVKQTIRNFFTSPVYPFTIHINNHCFTTEAFFISIANSNQFGNNVTIAPKASLTDGLLDIVVVNKMNRLSTVFALLKQIRSGKVNTETKEVSLHKGVAYFQSNSLRIENPLMAPLHIDGDPATTQVSFEVKIVHNAIRLLQP